MDVMYILSMLALVIAIFAAAGPKRVQKRYVALAALTGLITWSLLWWCLLK